MENFENIKIKIEESLKEALLETDYKLYSVCLNKDFSESVISVLLERKDKKQISLAEITEVSKLINQLFDNFTFISDNYALEVSSAGTSNLIKSLDDFKLAVGKHVYIEYHTGTGLISQSGELVNVEADGSFTMKYFMKGAPKKLNGTYNNINLVRYETKIN